MKLKRFQPFLLFSLPVILITVPLIIIWLGARTPEQKTPEEDRLQISAESSPEKTVEKVRPAAVAGQFYPADKGELATLVNNLLNEATASAVKGKINGLIVPHAGYEYSGKVAAAGFKQLSGGDFRTVIIIGGSHHESFDGIALPTATAFRTPLGDVPVDTSRAAQLTKLSPKIIYQDSTHAAEHSIEVELPFLQTALKDYKIVPILFGQNSLGLAKTLAAALKEIVDDRTLVVVSSDLSHYPVAADAPAVDAQTIRAILTGDAEHLETVTQGLMTAGTTNLGTTACGQAAIETLLLLTGNDPTRTINLLQYSNSFEVTGQQPDRVVGYAAVLVATQPTESTLGPAEQARLLQIARESVKTYVRTGQKPTIINNLTALNKPRGAFVTLKENNQLRGCIGSFEPKLSLYQVVSEMAIAAATQDARFSPVAASELQDLEYEISVLSSLRTVATWQDVQLGREGVQIVNGGHSGVFLPQVYKELGEDRNKFFEELCTQKAGLPRDCYLDPDTKISVFTADVFQGVTEGVTVGVTDGLFSP